MKISPSGKKWTADPEFGAFVGAICRYSTVAELEGVWWYAACALCRDELCRLPISNRKEIEDFVENHQPEIAGCILGANA
jgi:hypothetical protein